MISNYTVLGNKKFFLSEQKLCRVLAQEDCFAHKRIGFEEGRPFLIDKVQGYFNPINWWLSEDSVTLLDKEKIVTNLSNIIKRRSKAIAKHELTGAIGTNICILEKMFFRKANDTHKKILTPLFDEISESLRLGQEIYEHQSTLLTVDEGKYIEAEEFFDLLQKPEIEGFMERLKRRVLFQNLDGPGLEKKFQILENGSIYARPKKAQGWVSWASNLIFKTSEPASAKIATAQMIYKVIQNEANQEILLDCDLRAICKTLDEMKKKMIRNTSPAEALEITHYLTGAIIFLDEMYNLIQKEKPNLVQCVYNLTTRMLTDMALFVLPSQLAVRMM